MIKFLLNTILFFLFFSTSAQTNIINVSDVITKNALFESVLFLSSDKMNGRLTGTKEADTAAQYIAEKFEEAGLFPVVENKNYFQNFAIITKRGEVKAINVMGIIPRKDTTQDSIIIISAHYDHIGNGSYGAMSSSVNDTIYNGANDNATGVAALIEIAKYYTLLNENRHTIVFIAFAAEEWGLLGSKHENEVFSNLRIKAVINIEMLGRPISARVKKCMIISNNSRRIIKKLNNNTPEPKYFIEDKYPLESLNLRADHTSFPNCKNAFTLICTSPKDAFYHTPNDTIGTIDFPFLTTSVKNIAEACRIFIK